MITFQVSTYYLPKMALRLETLYERIAQTLHSSEPALTHFALMQLLELMKLLEKPEIKSRFLKELIRIEYFFNKLNQNKQMQQNLQTQIQFLSQHPGRFGAALFQDPILQSIRSQPYLGQQEVELDPPQVLFWLETPIETRQAQIKNWLEDIRPLYQSVKLYLSILRSTAEFQTFELEQSYFQQSISNKQPCHLVIVRLDKALRYIPKIQIGHHGINIRFFNAHSMKELKQSTVNFDLAVSQLG